MLNSWPISTFDINPVRRKIRKTPVWLGNLIKVNSHAIGGGRGAETAPSREECCKAFDLIFGLYSSTYRYNISKISNDVNK
jgi:hypothetical protein